MYVRRLKIYHPLHTYLSQTASKITEFYDSIALFSVELVSTDSQFPDLEEVAAIPLQASLNTARANLSKAGRTIGGVEAR